MVVKEFDYINGNTVAKPQRKNPDGDRQRQEEFKRKIAKRKRKKEEHKKLKMAVIQITACIFIMGMTIIYRDNLVYESKQEVTKIENEISKLQDENEALKVQLLKTVSLDNIKTTAEEKFGMFMASKKNTIQIEVPSSYYEKSTEEVSSDQGNENIFSKLMDALFS